MSSDAEERLRAEQKVRFVVFLKKIPLFSDFPTSTLRKILLLCSKVTLEAGEILCKEGAASDSMYILLSGKLQVNIRSSDVPVATIDPVSSIGEMGVFTGETRSATVIATQKSALFSLNKGSLNIFISKDPDFGVRIMSKVIKTLSERIAADNIKMQGFQKYMISKEEVQEAKTLVDTIPEDDKQERGIF